MLLGFCLTLSSLLKDPVFMSITLGYVGLTSFLAASVTYMSKYMESQFNQTASFANLVIGELVILVWFIVVKAYLGPVFVFHVFSPD